VAFPTHLREGVALKQQFNKILAGGKPTGAGEKNADINAVTQAAKLAKARMEEGIHIGSSQQSPSKMTFATETDHDEVTIKTKLAQAPRVSPVASKG